MTFFRAKQSAMSQYVARELSTLVGVHFSSPQELILKLSINCLHACVIQIPRVWGNLEEHFSDDQKKTIEDNKIDIRSWLKNIQNIADDRLKWLFHDWMRANEGQCHQFKSDSPPLAFPFNLPKLLVPEDFAMTTEDALRFGF